MKKNKYIYTYIYTRTRYGLNLQNKCSSMMIAHYLILSVWLDKMENKTFIVLSYYSNYPTHNLKIKRHKTTIEFPIRGHRDITLRHNIALL